MLYALNPAWERLLGWSREELTTRSLLAFVHPDDVEATADVLARTHIAGSKIDELVNRWRRRDGSYCTLAWSGASDGDVWCVVGRDVTGHAQERTLLREAQRIVELTNWEWHLDTDVVTTNFVAKVLVGTSRSPRSVSTGSSPASHPRIAMPSSQVSRRCAPAP